MKNIRSYIFPKTVEEAVNVLTLSPSARIVAGGTTMVFGRDARVETLVDITRMGLSYITEEDGFIKIGPTTTVAELLRSPIAAKFAGGILAEASKRVAGSHIRELATVGGDLAITLPWCDLQPAFLALDAELVIYNGEEKTISLEDYYNDRELMKRSGWLIKEIRVRGDQKGIGVFEKVSRTKIDYSTLDIAVYLEKDGGVIRSPRIAVGCAVPVSRRIGEVEKILDGQAPGPELFEKAAKIAKSSSRTVTNLRGTAAYRSHLIEIVTRRCLEKAWAALNGQEA